MIDAPTLFYVIGALGMIVGIPPCLYLLTQEEGIGEDPGYFGALLVIPGFAALMYVCMTFGVGTVTIQGYEIPFARYVDWLITTPILVGYAAYVSGLRRGTIVGLVLTDMAMIVTGAGATALSGTLKWAAFGISTLCFLGILGVIVGPAWKRSGEQLPARKRLARLLITHVGLLWIAYPIVWAFGPGTAVVSATAVAVIITYMDVLAKVPYVYFVYRAHGAMTEEVAETSGSALQGSRSAGMAASPSQDGQSVSSSGAAVAG